MAEERAALPANVVHMLEPLLQPFDGDDDGWLSTREPEEIRIGVVTSDLGSAGHPGTSCASDGGVLRAPPECGTAETPFLRFDPTHPDPLVFEKLDCLARTGVGECEIEQPLAAAVQVAFESEDFLREDAALAIVVITDGDDCSTEGSEVFAGDTRTPEIACLERGGLLRPVREIVAAAREAKGAAGWVQWALVAGIPDDLLLDGYRGGYQGALDSWSLRALLEDPRMHPSVVDGRMLPSCDLPGTGLASPPLRLVTALRESEDPVPLASICGEGWTVIGEWLSRQSEPRPWGCVGPRLATGDRAGCVLQELLPYGLACGPGRIDLGAREDSMRMCRVCQVGDGEDGRTADPWGNDLRACASLGPAWRYAWSNGSCDRGTQIEFARGRTPSPVATLELVCADMGGDTP